MSQQFGTFTASELYCPKCAESRPVREELVLTAPGEELHQYRCAECGTSVGERKVTAVAEPLVPVAAAPSVGSRWRKFLTG